MEIVIQNKNGRFAVGGGNHAVAKICEIEGLGLPASEPNTIKYAGQPGYKMLGRVDMERTITMSLDFYGFPSDLMQIYAVLQEECELIFFLEGARRRINGVCLNASEAEKIICGRMYKLVLQFACGNPYFEDLSEKVVPLSSRKDMFPSYFENEAAVIDLTQTPIATMRKSEIEISNRGDLEIRPVFEITAKEESEFLRISNLTTKKSIVIEKIITAGEKITIDTDGRRVVSDIDGSLINYLSDDTVMSEFVIAKGVNGIAVENGASNALFGSVRYKNKYKAVVLI